MQVTLVVNFDVPVKHETRQPAFETYLHRIGRSGRFGRRGAAFNLVVTAQVQTGFSCPAFPIMSEACPRNQATRESLSTPHVWPGLQKLLQKQEDLMMRMAAGSLSNLPRPIALCSCLCFHGAVKWHVMGGPVLLQGAIISAGNGGCLLVPCTPVTKERNVLLECTFARCLMQPDPA